ncbi:NfeD family protein [Paludibacterium yongneupense]|uniref:NfeD family protein n=1 Tax=Paludibacterium yongneupense TaxID=400061 RepID=UPI00041ED70D|nr:NfeD family protein [Paludibacterium yongneupense]
MSASPTLWFVLAVLALAAEFLSGTFYLLVVASALTGGGFAARYTEQLPLQLGTAVIVGLAALLLVTRWRRRLKRMPLPGPDDADIGQRVIILYTQGGDRLRVHFRGTEWDARLEGTPPLPGGSAFIAGKEGNLLLLTLDKPDRDE